MSIVRYEPLEALRDMNRLFDRVLQPSEQSSEAGLEQSHWLPSVDVCEKDKQYELKADLPGVDPDNVHVYMENNALVVRGERSEEHQEGDDSYSRIERFQGQFYRRFTLPETADSDNIEAEMNQGVLKVTIPKKQRTEQGKRIKIKKK